MKTQSEYEAEILKYYKKYIEKEMIEGIAKIDLENRCNDLIKFPYMYVDYNEPCSFTPTIFDYAVYSIKEKKFICIEYPWKNKKNKLVYNKIML